MKKTAKKLLALLLVTALCIGMTPAGTLKADSASKEIYTVTVDVTYQQTTARSMLEMINDMRTSEDAWAYDSKGEKVYYSNLSELEYDYELEKIAMQRAVELVLNFDHTRPDGTACTSAYTEAGYSCKLQGENIAVGYTTAEAAFTGWCETDEDYYGQGHRRNMLSSGYNRVGIACVKYKGITYWVQEFANSTVENSETTANDSEATVEVNVSSKMLVDSIAEFSPESYTLIAGDTVDLPEMTSYKVNLTSTWPTGSYKTIGTGCTWSSEDESKVTVDAENSTITAAAGGVTALDAATICGTYFIYVTAYELEYIWDGTGCTAVLTNPDYDPSDPSSIEKVEIACTVTSEITEAACEKDGSVTYTASFTYGDSGKTYTDTKTETIPATGHSYDAGVVTKEAACEEEGVITYTCTSCGDTYTETIPATGHSYDAGVVTKEAACEEEGVITYTCTSCGDTYTEAIPATGHDWNEPEWSWAEDGSEATATFTCGNDVTEVESVAAGISAETLQELGCEVEGIVKYTATVTLDGETYTDTKTVTTPATGHTYDEGWVSVEPTCTEEGKMIYTCIACGEIQTEAIPATGHRYDEGWVSVEPTCTEEGKMIYTCITCGEILAEAIPATGHSYEETGRVEPACTEDGQIIYTCKNCGDTYTETLDATGHTADAGTVTKEATCTEDGEITYTCTVCGATWTEVIPATGHSYDEGWISVEPTCTEEGKMIYTCITCGEILAETIPATGHSYEETGRVEASCTEDGQITYTCKNCGDTYTETLEATGHAAMHADAKAATETEDGNIEYWYCSECGKYFDDETLTTEITEADTVIAATGSKSESGTNTNNTSGNTAAGNSSTGSSTTGSSTATASETNATAENPAGVASNTNGSTNVAAQTADSAHALLWAFALMAAAAGSCALIGYDRKRKYTER